MNKAPLSPVVFTFIMGILAARYIRIPFLLFWTPSLLALILSIIFLSSRKRFPFFLILAIFFLGGAIFRNTQNLPFNHISNFVSDKGSHIYVEGIIDSDPIIRTKLTTFVFKAQRLIKENKNEKVCGRILVKVFGNRNFFYGDRLFIEGNVYKAPYYRISKRLNYRDYLKQKRIYSILSASKDSIIRLLEKGQGNPFKAFAFNIRRRIKRIIENNISPFSASILNAVILGQRSNLSNDLRKIMVQSGTVHIIAISGLHVGLVTFITLMALKIFRIPRKLCYVITAFVLIIYCLLTGARTPVIRVTIMALIFLFGYIIMRQTNIYNSLSFAALLILFFNPQELFNVSFQLSFMSIISIVGLSPKIKSLFGKGLLTNPYLRFLITLFSSSLAAWIGLSPLIAYYFNIISPIAILANMIIVPYLSIVIGSGLIFILAGFICPPFSHIFSASCEASIIFLIKYVSLLVRIPGAYFYLPGR